MGKKMSISSYQAAKKICELSNWTVTNLSLQKILYFIHMFYLGEERKTLINEDFEAWMYGPVIPSLYNQFKRFGADPIRNIFYDTKDISDDEINSFIEEIGVALIKRKPWELVTLTHNKEGAWAKNYSPKWNKIIPQNDILKEYKNRYEEKRK